MEQLINITDAVFLGHVGEVELGASALAGIYYLATYMLGFGSVSYTHLNNLCEKHPYVWYPFSALRFIPLHAITIGRTLESKNQHF